MLVALLSFLSAFGSQDGSSDIKAHNQWRAVQARNYEFYAKFYQSLDRNSHRCTNQACVKNINQKLDQLRKSDALQEQMGCFSFETWTPVCDKYILQDGQYIMEVTSQLERCTGPRAGWR